MQDKSIASKSPDWITLNLLLFVFSFGMTIGFPYLQNEYDTNMAMVVGLAVSSFVWMLGALLIGPLHVCKTGNLPTKYQMSIRRTLGIWTALLLLVHLFLLWKYKYDFTYAVAVKHGFWSFLTLHAAIVYVILMGLSSNTFSMNLIGYKKWKMFHRGLYILFPIILIEGIYQLYNVDTHVVIVVVVAIAGLTVPYFQLKSRKVFKSKFSEKCRF